MELTELFGRARKASVPLVSVSSPDPTERVQTPKGVIEAQEADNPNPGPVFRWDCFSGIHHENIAAKEVMDKLGVDGCFGTANIERLIDFLLHPNLSADDTTVFAVNGHLILDRPERIQAIFNLRDIFKRRGSMFVLISSQLDLPTELNDFVRLDESLPPPERVEAIIKSLYETTRKVKEAMPKLKDAAFKDYAETLRGLSGFQVEQSAAMAMSDLGINRAVLWEQKKQIIKTAKGLSVDEDALTLADIGGSSAIVEFGHRVFNGRKKPTAVVRVEEIEKKMGTEDRVSTSDVSADALDVYLNAMEDYGWGGVIALGPPGTGKSYFAKCLANTYGAISLAQDINATRGRYVGDSEKGIRENIKMIHAIGGSNVFFVATCNKLSTLPAALRRRFWMGTYFFDLPDEEEQMAVWKLCFARKGWKLGTKDPKFELPNFKDWTQAEIRNCVEFAWNFDCSLKEASGYILPTATSDAEGIKTLREAADGKFLSAAYKGAYHMKKEEQIARKIR